MAQPLPPVSAGIPFGLWLRQRRKALDLTQEKLAAAIDVSLPTIVKIEAGERRPSREVAELLARCLKVSAEELPDFMRLARTPLESPPTDALPPIPAATPLPPVPSAAPLRKPPAVEAKPAASVQREPEPGQPGRLPTPLTSFVGREREISAICDLMRNGGSPGGGRRAVSLIGPGGSGKTRLAIQVARLLGPQYGHGAWWVDLSPLRDAALVPDSVLRSLGMTPAPGQPPIRTLIHFLRERNLLLVLDNCEHLLEPCAYLVAAILEACGGVCVLVTSREPLGVPGEQLWPVPTFSVPDDSPRHEVDALLSYDSVRLFVERARMHRPSFALTADNAAQVAEICRRLNGIPLSIELAAARMRMMEVDAILVRLEHCLRLLASTSALTPPRQQTLRASIDWSYDLLSPAECLLLQRLAVFIGGCTLAAAEAVCSGGAPGTEDDLPEEDILDLLTRLVDRSLIVPAGGRYGFLESIREYALERLIETGAAEALRARHATYFADYLARKYQAILGAQQPQAMAEIAAEIGNVRAAWAWAVSAHRYDLLEASAHCLTWYYEIHSRFQEGEVVFGRVIDAMASDPNADRVLLARLRTHHGHFLDRLGRLGEGWKELDRGCAGLREGNRPDELAIGLTFQGINAFQRGDYSRARAVLTESLEICHAGSPGVFQEGSDKTYAALSLFVLGLVEHARGDVSEADERFREASALARALHQPRTLSMVAIHSAPTLLALGQYTEAKKRLQDGLAVAREMRDRWLMSAALGHLGMVLLVQGDHAGARTALLEAVALARETGSGWDRAWWEVSLGDVYLAERDPGEADLHFRSGLKLSLEANARPFALDALAGLAELRARAGAREEALEMARLVSCDPASAENARARAALVLRMLRSEDGEALPAAPAGDFEETVGRLLAGSEGSQ